MEGFIVQFYNSSNRFGAVAQILHWLTVLLVAAAWLLGQVGEELGGEGPQAPGIVAHIFIGLAVLAVLAIRVLWRLQDPKPMLEATVLGPWADRLATLTHYLLLLLLVLAPLSGIAFRFASGQALPVFGLFEIASPVSVGRATARSVKEVHELMANALLFVALAHAAAALFHHWLLGDRTLKRMLPGGD